MAKCCGNCGTQLNDTAVFCGGCGKAVPGGAPHPLAQSLAAAQPVAPARKSNTMLKIVAVCVLLVIAGTALASGGMWYAAQKIKEKTSVASSREAGRSLGLAAAMRAVGGSADGMAAGTTSAEFKGDPCRFLSIQEVGQAIGVTVIRADGEYATCTYIARGNAADMTAKHTSALVRGVVGSGMDDTQKKMIEGLTSGLLHQKEAQDTDVAAAAAKNEAPILGVEFTVGNAAANMKLSRATFGRMASDAGAGAGRISGDVEGIGDEAYLSAGVMLLVRKGDTLARFTFQGCPCTAENIKPLAKLIASRM